jgi:hypothetical protein
VDEPLKINFLLFLLHKLQFYRRLVNEQEPNHLAQLDRQQQLVQKQHRQQLAWQQQLAKQNLARQQLLNRQQQLTQHPQLADFTQLGMERTYRYAQI